MKSSKQTDETQIALMGKDISQIQKDVSIISIKLEDIKNTRYVTQNEMQLSIKDSRDVTTKEIGILTEQLNAIRKLLWFIGTTFGISVITAFAKLVLKI